MKQKRRKGGIYERKSFKKPEKTSNSKEQNHGIQEVSGSILFISMIILQLHMVDGYDFLRTFQGIFGRLNRGTVFCYRLYRIHSRFHILQNAVAQKQMPIFLFTFFFLNTKIAIHITSAEIRRQNYHCHNGCAECQVEMKGDSS